MKLFVSLKNPLIGQSMVNNILHHPFFCPAEHLEVPSDFCPQDLTNLGFDQAKVREALQAIGNPADKEAAINWFLRPQLPW